jgi:hypothetical protein
LIQAFCVAAVRGGIVVQAVSEQTSSRIAARIAVVMPHLLPMMLHPMDAL